MSVSWEPDPVALSNLQQIASVRCDYQNAFDSGANPRIEEFLTGWVEPYRSAVFKELLELDIELRRDTGEPPLMDDYVRRFPEYSALIGRAFDHRPESIPRTFGEFEIIRQIGRGGMGIVFEARHRSLAKRVAVKFLPNAGMLDHRGRARFRNEARAAAQLQHPHIVPVFAIGLEHGLDYYVMQFVEGHNLAELLRLTRPTVAMEKNNAGAPPEIDAQNKTRSVVDEQSSQEERPHNASDTKKLTELASTHRSGAESTKYSRFVAKLFVDVASALQHAHDCGVVHRDIKPSNLMLDDNNHIWVTDFGLAQIQGEPELTFTGDVLGTLRYMSPEQALAKRVVVDHRTDVYSLGVTLYEMLTFRPAFDGATREEVLRQIAFQDPPQPRKLNRSIPEDLNTIVTKSISKRPDERYQSAQAMADDLNRYLRNEPIHARPASVMQRMSKWGQRHRAIVASLLGICLVTFAAGVVTFAAVLNAKNNVDQELSKNLLLNERLTMSVHVADSQRDVALAVQAIEKTPTKSLRMGNQAAAKFENSAVRDAITGAIMALQERYTLIHDDYVMACRYSPDGHWLATVVQRTEPKSDSPSAVCIWNTESGKLQETIENGDSMSMAVFSPDSRHVLVAARPAKGKPTTAPSYWKLDPPTSVAFPGSYLLFADPEIFHPSGERIVLPAEDSTARVYELADPDSFQSLNHDGQRVTYAAFSPDGQHIVTVAEDASQEPTVRVFRVEDNSLVFTKQLHGGSSGRNRVRSVEFHPSRHMLLTGSDVRGTELWSIDRGNQLNRHFWRGNHGFFDHSGERIACVSGFGHTIDVRDRESGEVLGNFALGGRLIDADLSPNKRLLATIDGETTGRVWDLDSLELVSVFYGHTGQLTDVQFAPNNGQVATTGGIDSTARIWDVLPRGERFKIRMPVTPTGAPLVHATSDGKQLLAVAPPKNEVTIWNFNANSPATSMPGTITDDSVSSALCLTIVDGHVAAWNPATAPGIQRVGRLGLMELPWWDNNRPLAYSAVSGWAAIGISDGRLVFWNPSTNQRVFIAAPNGVTLDELVLSFDGRQAACAYSDGTVRIWSTTDGRLLAELSHRAQVRELHFSPSGTRLVAVTNDESAFIWDLDTLSLRQTINRAGKHFKDARLSPAGDYVITLDPTQASLLVWDAASGELLRSFEELRGPAQFAVSETENIVAISALGDENGGGAGARLWRFADDDAVPITLLDRPTSDIAIGRRSVIAAVDSASLAGRRLPVDRVGRWDPARYAADEAPPPTGRWQIALWDLDGTQLGSRAIEADFVSLRILENPDRVVIQCRQHGIAAHSSKDNDRHFVSYGHVGPISDIVSTRDTAITAGHDGQIICWALENGLRAPPDLRLNTPIMDIDVDPTDVSQIAIAAADGIVRLWNSETDAITEAVPRGFGQAWFVQFDRFGQKLLSVHRGGSVVLSDLTGDGQVQRRVITSEQHVFNHAEFSPDGNKVLALEGMTEKALLPSANRPGANPPQYLVRIFSTDVSKHEPLADLPHSSPVTFAQFDAEGKRVLTIDLSGEITIWNVAKGSKVRRIGRAQRIDHYDKLLSTEAAYAEFSPDNRFIYAEFSDPSGADDYARLFRTSDGRELFKIPLVHSTRASRKLPWGKVSSAFTPDSQWILPGYGGRTPHGYSELVIRKTPTRPVEYGRKIQPGRLEEE